jgi:hypothetical protein
MLPAGDAWNDILPALREAGIVDKNAGFPVHFYEDPGFWGGFENGRFWLKRGDDYEKNQVVWFDTIEEANAWALAMWRLR